jgi:N6-L-threonylcarbamoyladenine synthase
MTIVLGIESTAHTFGIGIVINGKILSNVKKSFTTKKGGLIPMEVAKHHFENKNKVYFEALDQAGIKEKNINAISFSQGPGLAPCLLEGMKFAKELSLKLKLPLVCVNHCIAHLEIGKLAGVKDSEAGSPVMLYVSGANTQVIAYASGKYRIFGETLDIGVGNFIDNFARYAGIGFPGGPKIEKLALKASYPDKSSEKISTRGIIELPYKVKGMDIALSGILTNLRQKLNSKSQGDTASPRLPAQEPAEAGDSSKDDPGGPSCEPKYSLNDLSYSMQETVFAMLVETAERALAHTGKKELLLGGGVACNSRLQEMCKIMCKERGAKFFCPEKSLLTDNGAMIAYLGEIIFKKTKEKFSYKKLKQIDIKPRQRTDEVKVKWK